MSNEVIERPTLFDDTMRELNRRQFGTEVDEKLMELTKAVAESGGSGSIAVTLTIKRAGEGEVMVQPKLAVKLPAKKAYESAFFVDPDTSRLVRDNPKQKQLFADQGERKAA